MTAAVAEKLEQAEASSEEVTRKARQISDTLTRGMWSDQAIPIEVHEEDSMVHQIEKTQLCTIEASGIVSRVKTR